MKKKRDIVFDGSNIYRALIYYENHKHYYSRWYSKIPDVLARTSGIIKIFYFFILLIYSFYSKFRFNSFLCEKLIYIDDETDETKNNIKNFLNKKNFENIDNDLVNRERSFLQNNYNNDKSQNNDLFPNNKINEISKNEAQNKDKSEKIKTINFSDNIRERHLQKKRQTAKGNCIKYLEMKEINKSKSQINDNSQRILIEDDVEKEKEKIKSLIVPIIDKFSAPKNSFNFKILKILLGAICPKKYPIENKHKRIISYFGEKFNEKLDIFYYFRQDKINKLIENIVLTKEQNRLKDLI